MSCDYADGLSPYIHKGILGAPEKFDSPDKVEEKCRILTQLIKDAKHIVVHTGAGISTSAGIPDFRGPNGVWTLEKKGLKPNLDTSFGDAKPTLTHLALKKLTDENIIKFVVSQNIDGLHLKSGLGRKYLAELHGNMFIEQCDVCKRQFVRSSPAPTVGQKPTGIQCYGKRSTGRRCRGKLHDIILDWEHSLPDDDLDMADMHSCIADLSICLGTTLQIVPSGNLPLNTIKYGGKLVICNLQPTKHDNKADLIINTFVDDVLRKIMKNLGYEIPDYNSDSNPTTASGHLEWTICRNVLSDVKKIFKSKCEGVAKKRVLVKTNKILSNVPVKKIKTIKNELQIKSERIDNLQQNVTTSVFKSEEKVEVKKEEEKQSELPNENDDQKEVIKIEEPVIDSILNAPVDNSPLENHNNKENSLSEKVVLNENQEIEAS